MSRPSRITIQSGQEGWDADTNDDFTLAGIGANPMLAPEFGSEGALPTAGLWDRCVVAVDNATSGWTLYISDGTNWVPLAKQATAQAASAGWADATAQTDFNALLTKLRASGALDT